jgi:hypothetical protein
VCAVVGEHGAKALSCIVNGTASSIDPAFCTDRHFLEYGTDLLCQQCSSTVHTINSVVFATATIGGVSTAACLAVGLTIVAHSRDRESQRARIMLGLMVANAVHSSANAIPLAALLTSATHCGDLALSFETIRFGRAWWFTGKYGLVCLELFIIGASMWALRSGTSAVPRWVEGCAHTSCFAAAALAFAVLYAMCSRINANGYNTITEDEAITGAYEHLGDQDDLDDHPVYAAYLQYGAGRNSYDSLVRNMLVAWDLIVGVAVVLWIALRVLHLHVLRALRSEVAAMARAESNDEWRDTRRSAWEARRLLVKVRGDAFAEVAKPLEPYIFVFVVFSVPAIVMSTAFCQSHSGERESNYEVTGYDRSGGSNNGGDQVFTYGTCDVWCEFVLAFRSLATVALFLRPRRRREDLMAVRTTLAKLRSRLRSGCVAAFYRAPATSYLPLPRTPTPVAVEMTGLHLLEAEATRVCSGLAASENGRLSCQIDEHDLVRVNIVGKGAYGEVWSGILKPHDRAVAIKIIRHGALVDDDGDLIHPEADAEFRSECAALQRFHSPHLVEFIGFGASAGRHQFIVTELMALGSLENALSARFHA